MKLDDNALVSECLKGNLDAFEILVGKYEKPIFNIAYRLTKNYDDAEDITQIVFINAYENLKSYSPKYKFFSWIYRSAINNSINLINRNQRQAELNQDITTNEKSVEDVVTGVDLSDRIQAALGEIDINYRIVIVLKHFMNFSYQEISEIVEVPEKKIKSRLFTARQLLKEILIKNKVV